MEPLETAVLDISVPLLHTMEKVTVDLSEGKTWAEVKKTSGNKLSDQFCQYLRCFKVRQCNPASFPFKIWVSMPHHNLNACHTH